MREKHFFATALLRGVVYLHRCVVVTVPTRRSCRPVLPSRCATPTPFMLSLTLSLSLSHPSTLSFSLQLQYDYYYYLKKSLIF